MGMYSTFKDQDITITNHDLISELEKEETCNLIDNGEIDFQEWDNNKLEGYWYNETVNILTKLALAIEGWAEFHYEEGYDFRIVFKDGKVFIRSQPNIDWEGVELNDLREVKP